jgi:hypothetical protein
MQPEPTNASQNVSHQQAASDTTTTSQHGQLRDDDLQDSLQPHPGELRGEPEPPKSGHARNATRSDEDVNEVNAVEADGLKGAASSSPPPRDRITEYENALADSPRKPSGPLFEIIKSTKKPGDKNSPIAKLPNGEYLPSLGYCHVDVLVHVLTLCRGPHPRHCPSFAERPRRCVTCLAPLQ